MVRLAPFGLLRIAALPVGPLQALAPSRTSQLVAAALAALDRMRASRAPIEDALHALVPSLQPRTRSAALELRRAVHNERSPALGADRIADVLAALPEHGRALLTDWLVQQRARDASLAMAEAVIADEVVGHVRPALEALAADEAFLRPLVLASPTLFTRCAMAAQRSGTRLEATKRERSLLLYVARAAAKCSPFSVFMHQALVEIASTGTSLSRPDACDRHSRTYLDRGLLFRLHAQAVASAGDAVPCYTVNSSIRFRAEENLDALVPEYVAFSHRLLRVGKPATLRFPSVLAERVARLPSRFSRAELRESLTAGGLPRDAAEQCARQLCERGLVQPEPFTTGFEAHPEDACAVALAAIGGSAHADASAAVTELATAAGAFGSAPSGRRAALLEESRSPVERAWRSLGAAPAEWVRAPFWEDGFFRHPLGPIGAGIHGLLPELAAVLRPHAVVTAPYRALCDYFVEECGSGGACHDVPGLLARASAALARRRWWLLDPATMECAASADSRVGTTVSVQFSASSEATLASGGGTLVVNQAYPGCGWLSARHAFGDAPYHDALRRELREWLASAHAPAEPVDIMLSGDCNGLQAHPRLTRRVLGWPIEPRGRSDGGMVPISSVSLCHDPRSGLLDLFDAGGGQLAPVYLGTTVPVPAWGPAFWLATLAWPHRIRRPMEEISPPSDPSAELLALSRRVVGRVVLGRASWWMRSTRMRRVWFRRSGAARLLDVAADCAAFGVPRRLFVRAARSARRSPAGEHKPLWIDTQNPFCLDVLAPVAADAEWLSLTEALPDVPVWPILSGVAHVSDLLVEMVL